MRRLSVLTAIVAVAGGLFQGRVEAAFSTPTTRTSRGGTVFHRPSMRSAPKNVSFISTVQLNMFGKKQASPKKEVVQGVGPEGCALPSPSRVNTLPQEVQATIVLGLFAALGSASVVLSSLVDDISMQYEWIQNWRYTWPLLGAIYAAAGVTHFTIEEEFCNIYPPQGTWGIWYLPGSASFHVRWTGIAEVLFGLGLLIGGGYDAFTPVWTQFPDLFTSAGIESDSAAALLAVTVAVTPTNIYMYTHGARLPMDGPEVPVVGHAVRGALQVLLLVMLYQMGQGTFEAILSN